MNNLSDDAGVVGQGDHWPFKHYVDYPEYKCNCISRFGLGKEPRVANHPKIVRKYIFNARELHTSFQP
jgi:hypothetical protein